MLIFKDRWDAEDKIKKRRKAEKEAMRRLQDSCRHEKTSYYVDPAGDWKESGSWCIRCGKWV